MTLLESLTGWHWLLLGVVLMLGQVTSAGRPLLGGAVGALLVAAVMAVIPLDWRLQLSFFAAFALLATALYWRYLRVKPAKNATTKLASARRRSQLMGTRASLLAPVKDGRGTVQIRDALWPVSCGQDLPAGTLVEVTGFDDEMLHVSRVRVTAAASS